MANNANGMARLLLARAQRTTAASSRTSSRPGSPSSPRAPTRTRPTSSGAICKVPTGAADLLHDHGRHLHVQPAHRRRARCWSASTTQDGWHANNSAVTNAAPTPSARLQPLRGAGQGDADQRRLGHGPGAVRHGHHQGDPAGLGHGARPAQQRRGLRPRRPASTPCSRAPAGATSPSACSRSTTSPRLATRRAYNDYTLRPSAPTPTPSSPPWSGPIRTAPPRRGPSWSTTWTSRPPRPAGRVYYPNGLNNTGGRRPQEQRRAGQGHEPRRGHLVRSG